MTWQKGCVSDANLVVVDGCYCPFDEFALYISILIIKDTVMQII